jgi:hypothetical protein
MVPNIRIASPCTADWSQMTGDNRVRHCSQCDLNVYNFSAMTAQEISQLISASKGQRLCGRLYRRADGTLLTSDCPVGFRAVVRRISRYAGVALSTALSAIPATAQTQHIGSSLMQIAPAETGIVVTVVDPTGAVIPSADVWIRNHDGKVAEGKTDERGRFTSQAVVPGAYEVTVHARGFETQVQWTTASRSVVTLDVFGVEMNMGVVADVEVAALPISPARVPEFLPEPALSTDSTPLAILPQSKNPPRPSALKSFLRKLGF